MSDEDIRQVKRTTERESVEVWPVYTYEPVDDHSSIAVLCETRELAQTIAGELDGLPDSFGDGVQGAWASARPLLLYREGGEQ